MTSGIRLADELGGICEVDECPAMTTSIVYSSARGEVLLCCEAHAYQVVDEGSPEYHHTCPNCGCEQPIS